MDVKSFDHLFWIVYYQMFIYIFPKHTNLFFKRIRIKFLQVFNSYEQ